MLPRVIMHNAISVDGRFDWLKPDLAQFYELASRWKEDATLAGSDTLIAGMGDVPVDGPEASAPTIDPGDKRALLVVPDSKGRIRFWNQVRKWPYWRDVVVLCSKATPGDYLEYLRRIGVDYITSGQDHVDLRAALEELSARYGVYVVRADAGGTLNGILLRAGLVDEISVIIEPCLVGGTTPRTLFHAPDLESEEGVIPIKLAHIKELKNGEIWLLYEVIKHKNF